MIFVNVRISNSLTDRRVIRILNKIDSAIKLNFAIFILAIMEYQCIRAELIRLRGLK